MAAVLEALDAARRKPRVFHQRIDPLQYLSDNEVVERYRLTIAGIEELEKLIEGDCGPATDRSCSLSVRTKLLVTLRYLAKGDFFSEVGDLHGISRSSVSRCIEQVIAAITKNLENITFPITPEELAAAKLDFYKIAGVPNVLGAVDGTLISIEAPSKDEKIYVCRKGFHAVNVQAVVNSKLRFINVNAKWPGSTHDSTVFENSNIKRWMEVQKPGCLLGDSGYPLKQYLLTPKLNPSEGKETRYNIAHSRTRVCVERAFGLLKARFRCLHRSGGSLPFNPQKCMEIISVCARLHNFCMDLNIHMDLLNVDGDDDEDDDALEANNGPENQSGVEFRQRIIDRF